jgi:hypothetical protein
MLQIVKKIIIAPGVFHYWIEAAGWRAALTWAVPRTKAALGFQQPSGLKIKPRQAKYPVFVRRGASSDINVFHQIFALDDTPAYETFHPPA